MNEPINEATPKESIRDAITFSDRKFDIGKLPGDMRRIYKHLEAKYDEEYALLFVFTMRTAVELHRAWHMTLLTSKILQQIKDKFKLTMTWDLGVVRLKFRVDDGGFEIHRKVPYDYDSEYQDIYMRIAVALIDGHIGVHEALNYQEDTLKGLHTAKSGIFLRNFPGRLLLYPLEAATCAVIFFGGDFEDAGIAAICGFATGLVDMILGRIGGDFKILTDVIVGVITGIIGGLFYHYAEGGHCLRSIFLGTLYWFFYGTAFVIGILEIIAGELETGVTRFIAVSVKTFVLSLGAGLGLMIATSSEATNTWFESQNEYCGRFDLSKYWWRIPLYLLCSASVLGQYRFPVVQYWRGLVVMLCAYEVQYQSFSWQSLLHSRDNLDTSMSNIAGAAAGVVSACILCFFINYCRSFYTKRLLQPNSSKNYKVGDVFFKFMVCAVRAGETLRIGRQSDFHKLQVAKKLQVQRAELKDVTHARQDIKLHNDEEDLVLEAIVGGQEVNVWSILMPALYQLVPGSIIAQLWFNSIFPPSAEDEGTDSVFSNLMVISTSLALGLIVGFVIVQMFGKIFLHVFSCGKTDKEKMNSLERLAGMYSAPYTVEDDPEPVETSDDALDNNNSNELSMTNNVVGREMESYFHVASHDERKENDAFKAPNEEKKIDNAV